MFSGMLNYIYNTLKFFKVFYILIKYQWALKGQEREGDLGHKGSSGGGSPPFLVCVCVGGGGDPNRGGSWTPPRPTHQGRNFLPWWLPSLPS